MAAKSTFQDRRLSPWHPHRRLRRGRGCAKISLLRKWGRALAANAPYQWENVFFGWWTTDSSIVFTTTTFLLMPRGVTSLSERIVFKGTVNAPKGVPPL